MKRDYAQYFINDRRVTKREFLDHNDTEIRMDYVSQKHLIDNKIFSPSQIDSYEKQNLLIPILYKHRKYFKKEAARKLIDGE